MAQERSMTMKVQIDGRTIQQEDAMIAFVKEQLTGLAGDPRPVFEVARVQRETV